MKCETTVEVFFKKRSPLMWNSILYSCTTHLKFNFVNSTGKIWLYLIEIQLDKIMLLSNLSLKTHKGFVR